MRVALNPITMSLKETEQETDTKQKPRGDQAGMCPAPRGRRKEEDRFHLVLSLFS